MEQHRDERIVCADCGESFLFSAGEATTFAERGLTAPKRCKECRRARKDSSSAQSRGEGTYAQPGARGNRGPAPRPRYTGDVNEYRSPMQDSYSPTLSYAGRRGPGRPVPGGPMDLRAHGAAAWSGAGSAPAHVRPKAARSGPPFARNENRGRGPARDAAPGGHAAGSTRGAAPISSARRRVQPEMFSISCSACGKNAEVPFRPAEGREVFCQACYRARKPESQQG